MKDRKTERCQNLSAGAAVINTPEVMSAGKSLAATSSPIHRDPGTIHVLQQGAKGVKQDLSSVKHCYCWNRARLKGNVLRVPTPRVRCTCK